MKKTVNRRGFLKTTVLSGLGVALVPFSALRDVTDRDEFEKKVKAAAALIKRVVPGYQNQFMLELIPPEGDRDVFEYEAQNGQIVLRGNSGVSIASALNWYLKKECKVYFSRDRNPLHLPDRLFLPAEKVRKTIDATYRVHFNYCTFSYSMVWWDWERWQREIDFLAMHGVNMPLAMVGIEGVWYYSLRKMGFTDLETRSFLVGPPYFSWQWMTNIQSFGGPLPKNWISQHIHLGQKIINRELELGMHPVQKGFSGYVPRLFMDRFPDAKILQEKEWVNFNGTAQLDPLDPLFEEFGQTFLAEQKRLFGSHHFYGTDPFHEGVPPQNGAIYLQKVGAKIHKLLKDFDPNARWVMQSWSIRKDIAVAVPEDDLLILDLNGSTWKTHDNFWGRPFVVGNLHNMGGRINMHGNLKNLASNQYQRVKEKAPNVVGSGLFMEGIGQGQHPVFYDLALEMPFYNSSIDVVEWLHRYARHRYGIRSKRAAQAWEILLHSAYQPDNGGLERSSIIAARPALDVKKSGPNAGLEIPYDPKQLIYAQQLLLKNVDKLQNSDGYRFDIVDLQRQILSNLGQELQKKWATAFKKRDEIMFEKYSSLFLELLLDIDKLLATRSEFSFDRWVCNARSWGQNPEEEKQYAFNASMLVTWWGPIEDPVIFDYSWHEWSGLIHKYYYPRWQKFVEMLDDHLQAGTQYTEEGLPYVYGRETLRANAFYDQLAKWEFSWIKKKKELTPEPVGDEVKLVKKMSDKYRPIFSKIYAQVSH